MSPENEVEVIDSIWLGDADGKGERSRSEADSLLVALDLSYGSGPGKLATKRAVAALKQRMAVELGVVYYGRLQDPGLGKIFLAANKRGLVSVAIGGTEARFVERVSKRTGSKLIQDPGRVKAGIRQLKDFLSGRRKGFDLPVDLSQFTDFQCRVLWATSMVPAGQMTTYRDIAQRIGKPRAARAVGQALANNPVPIVIPCHRVVAKDGSMTGYSGGKGVETKVRLLKLEGAILE
jgi:methylated-DNA-[protein]-cysteine S-methyltransferase